MPPLSTSNGRKNTKAIFAAMMSSKAAIPAPENRLPNTSKTSHNTRLRYNIVTVAVLRLPMCVPIRAPLWKSSVASSTTTSMASSHVTIPTNAPSALMMGKASKS
ncbi:hypothetical protein D3C81_1348300 [compost metagenome]